MSRSSKDRYDGSFPDAFNDFLQLVDKASITYKREVLEVNGKEESEPEVRFNFISSMDKYQKALSSSFSESCDEIEEYINGIHQKTAKLNVVSRYIVEVEAIQSMLQKDGGSVNHIRFYFSNISQGQFSSDTLSQKDFQTYYYWMELYIIKCKSFLSLLKHTIEITPQSEFPIPAGMIANPNTSTKENPLAFFDFLIVKSGIATLRRNFIPSEDSHYYIHGYISYDEATETTTIEEQHPETGDWIVSKTEFKDVLFNRCFKEHNVSKQLIDERILKAVVRDEITLFVELLLNQLKYLKKAILKNKEALKYVDIPRPIDALIRFLFEKHNSFCPKIEDDVVLNTVIQASSNAAPLIPSLLPALPKPYNPGGFKWIKGEPITLSTILFIELNTHFIADTEIAIFHKVFSGEHLEAPLCIKWIDKPNSGAHVNRVTLLYLFQQLNESGLIDTPLKDDNFLNKLEFLFTAPDGSKLDNWGQSKGSLITAKTKTPAKKRIDTIVTLLLSKAY